MVIFAYKIGYLYKDLLLLKKVLGLNNYYHNTTKDYPKTKKT